jgi:hypothetical protein
MRPPGSGYRHPVPESDNGRVAPWGLSSLGRREKLTAEQRPFDSSLSVPDVVYRSVEHLAVGGRG